MNTKYSKHIFALAATLFLGWTVSSCSKAEPSPEAPQAEQLAPGERFVEVDLSSVVGQNDDNFRFSYYDKDFYSTSGGAKLYPIIENKNLEILVVARQQGGVTAYNKLEFRKESGRSVKYTGKIKVPNSNKNQVELAAIILREIGGRQFVTFDATSKRARVIPSQGAIMDDATGTVNTTVPYLARWTPIEIVDDLSIEAGARLKRPATLHFKPSGTLLRFEISYAKEPKREPDGSMYYETIEVRELQVRTNAFYLNWEYDFEKLGNAPSMEPNTLADGVLVDQSSLNRDFHFRVNRTIQANGTTTPGYFIWAMPRTQADKDANLRTDFIMHLMPNDGFLELKRISTKFLPNTGASHNITLPAEYGKDA